MSRFPWGTRLGTIGAACALVLGAGCGPPDDDAGDGSDEAAASADTGATAAAEDGTADSVRILADRLMEWQGGDEAWERTRFLRFRWVIGREGETVAQRSHAWDRSTGRYRLDQERDGEQIVALFDVTSVEPGGDTPEGIVWVDRESLEGAARDSALRNAYGAFINDSYWLLMPLKWGDRGVHLTYEGWTELPDGERYPTVSLGFEEQLGITNDRYWAYLDPETGRMAAWRYLLEGQEEPGPIIWWEDWRDVGPIQLATERRWEDGSTRIHFENLEAGDSVPPGAFDQPVP